MSKPKSVFDVYAEVEEIADYKERWSKIKGSRTNLGFSQFVWQLLTENEIQKHTDKTLLHIILQEFNHSDSTRASFESGNQSLAKLRYEYNTGKLQGKGWPPEHPGQNRLISLRYNIDKQPVITSAPTQVATNGWLKDQLKKFSDTVLETPEELFIRLGRKKYNWNRSDAVE